MKKDSSVTRKSVIADFMQGTEEQISLATVIRKNILHVAPRAKAIIRDGRLDAYNPDNLFADDKTEVAFIKKKMIEEVDNIVELLGSAHSAQLWIENVNFDSPVVLAELAAARVLEFVGILKCHNLPLDRYDEMRAFVGVRGLSKSDNVLARYPATWFWHLSDDSFHARVDRFILSAKNSSRQRGIRKEVSHFAPKI